MNQNYQVREVTLTQSEKKHHHCQCHHHICVRTFLSYGDSDWNLPLHHSSTGNAMPTGLSVHLHCHSIVGGWFSATGACHSRAALFLQPPAQVALGRHWAVTDRPSRRAGRLCFFKVLIVISDHVVISANVRAKKNSESVGHIVAEETCSFGVDTGFQFFFQTFFLTFPNFLEKLALEIFWKKMVQTSMSETQIPWTTRWKTGNIIYCFSQILTKEQIAW